ncbi:MAG: hypothetical protein LUH10_12580 [Tannerellaceae bacterium]|nr:hypothetical protein [Tannerellaceae bacterium]
MNNLLKKAGLPRIMGIVTLIVLLSGCAGNYDKKLQVASKLFNKACPVMVDDDTRLDNTEVFPGKIFRYNYTLVNLSIEDMEALNEETRNMVISQMEEYILNAVRTENDLKEFRDNDVTMEYNYHDKNGNPFHMFTFTPDSYK